MTINVIRFYHYVSQTKPEEIVPLIAKKFNMFIEFINVIKVQIANALMLKIDMPKLTIDVQVVD